ncbi:MAG: type II secretion system protein [Chloroflexi bacterium]|nr:type II secretion system protein [Chloroflexota bacterium]
MARNQHGFSLAEVLVTLAIMGTFGVALLSGLTTVTKSTPIIDEISTAQSLAERQIESVRVQAYDYMNNPPQYTVFSGTAVPNGYEIGVVASRLDHDDDGPGDDDGIQQVSVTVMHGAKSAFSLEGYKVR